MTRRWAGLMLAAVLMLLLTPAPAGAIDLIPGDLGDCKEAPIPERPGGGVAGVFDSRPDPLPPARDPFAANTSTSVYEQYGWAGLRWNTYDLGCGGSARDPGAATGNAFGNFALVVPKALGAAAVGITRWAYSPESWIGKFDPLIVNVSQGLRDTFFAPWAPLMLIGLGVWVLWRARGGSAAAAATAIGAALLVMVGATALFAYPLQAARVADQTVPAVLGPVNAGLARQNVPTGTTADPVAKVAANLQNVMWTQWLEGTVGDAGSRTAVAYGPDLFRATTLTWQEDTLTGDTRKDMLKEKVDLWTDTAEKIKDEDPDAYTFLTGKRAESRPEAAYVAAFGTIAAVPFPIISALLIIVSYLIVRLAVMVAPLIGALAVFPPFLPMALGIMRVVFAALANVIAFGVGSAVTVAGIVLLLDPKAALPRPIALLLVALLGLVMWLVLRPFRKLTQMVRNPDPFQDATGGVGDQLRSTGRFIKRTAVQAGTAGVGSYLGTKEALEDDREAEGEQAQKASRFEAETPPVAGDTPVTPQALTAGPVVAAEANSPSQATGARPHAGATPPVGLPSVAAETSPPTATGTALPASREPKAADSAPPMPPAPDSPPGSAPGGFVAVPDRPGLYRAGGEDVAPVEQDAPLPRTVDATVVDGEDVFVIYRSGGGTDIVPVDAAEARDA